MAAAAQVASAEVEFAQVGFTQLAFVVALIVVASTEVAPTVAASMVVAITARAWRWALLRSAPLRSVLPPRGLTTVKVTMAQPRSPVDTATIIISPTTAVYPRHSRCGRTSEERKQIAAAPLNNPGE